MNTPGEGEEAATLQAAFERFHEANPQVYAKLQELAVEWLANHRKVGVGMLWEVMRWQLGVKTDGVPYRLNNDYRSRYARLLLAEHPEWEDRIETRVLRAA